MNMRFRAVAGSPRPRPSSSPGAECGRGNSGLPRPDSVSHTRWCCIADPEALHRFYKVLLYKLGISLKKINLRGERQILGGKNVLTFLSTFKTRLSVIKIFSDLLVNPNISSSFKQPKTPWLSITYIWFKIIWRKAKIRGNKTKKIHSNAFLSFFLREAESSRLHTQQGAYSGLDP